METIKEMLSSLESCSSKQKRFDEKLWKESEQLSESELDRTKQYIQMDIECYQHPLDGFRIPSHRTVYFSASQDIADEWREAVQHCRSPQTNGWGNRVTHKFSVKKGTCLENLRWVRFDKDAQSWKKI